MRLLVLKKILLAACILVSYASMAQSQFFRGKVVDQTTSQPLAGATITNISSGRNTTSGEDGLFQIDGNLGDSIEVL